MILDGASAVDANSDGSSGLKADDFSVLTACEKKMTKKKLSWQFCIIYWMFNQVCHLSWPFWWIFHLQLLHLAAVPDDKQLVKNRKEQKKQPSASFSID